VSRIFRDGENVGLQWNGEFDSVPGSFSSPVYRGHVYSRFVIDLHTYLVGSEHRSERFTRTPARLECNTRIG
jgi:hypothetical protein